MANVDKTKCNTACSTIGSCYRVIPEQKLEAKKERPAINSSAVLVSQSKIAIQEAERNIKKDQENKKSKKDTEGYVHKLSMLLDNYQSIYQSIFNVYSSIDNLEFVNKKVKDNLQTAKINFGGAVGKLKKYTPIDSAKKQRRMSTMGIKLPPLK